ncbi:uncharacterized protein ASCRUDRAFT_76578 [Ascoidea rubescens DSM 1968]|uniref:Uncharacterized protein n=1 Tax=Ascoidea rubescens DSM 1968 TaxID=1344418 RepID=A0A1D2VEE2_9ASCO|nr:hypothetical protein ASCRUDRAFT_76578 [Ascoidea rubescens DSM 1968]ODV60054.1 hypothetical protein ASCRUDRAFT_76578 [Ascoidea rubescens DSM 1968]
MVQTRFICIFDHFAVILCVRVIESLLLNNMVIEICEFIATVAMNCLGWDISRKQSNNFVISRYGAYTFTHQEKKQLQSPALA